MPCHIVPLDFDVTELSEVGGEWLRCFIWVQFVASKRIRPVKRSRSIAVIHPKFV